MKKTEQTNRLEDRIIAEITRHCDDSHPLADYWYVYHAREDYVDRVPLLNTIRHDVRFAIAHARRVLTPGSPLVAAYVFRALLHSSSRRSVPASAYLDGYLAGLSGMSDHFRHTESISGFLLAHDAQIGRIQRGAL